MRGLLICAIALAFGFAGSMPLAGPISVMVVSRAARREFGDAWRIGVGAAVAEGIYAAVAFWGFATFLARHAIVVPISHGVTALVLVVLGVRFVLFASREQPKSEENKAGSALLGFSISVLNPTLLASWSAIVAFLYSKGLRELPSAYAIPFGLCAAAGVGAWFVLLVGALRKYEGTLPRLGLTMIVRFLGIVLLVLGLWSGVQLVQWLVGDRDALKVARSSRDVRSLRTFAAGED
ncbi:MAG: LysE family transporter [Myxococcota bacterium]|nr:LysE family transporter [Myxococcota bacterium]